MDEKEISIEEQTPAQDISEETAQLPLNFLSVGTIEKDDVKIYIHQSVVSSLEEFARSDTKNELGSILLGTYSAALGQTAVVISEFIEAKYTDASASTLTFTHETWDYVHKEQAEKWPELRIVGWQHTHPGYGIFLSNYDLFIQENFFNLPFQIAYVIDPVQNIRGFFCWKNGRVEKLKGYYIYDEPGKPLVPPTEGVERPETENGASRGKQTANKKSLLGIIIALAITCTGLAGAVVWMWLHLAESDAQIQELYARQHAMQEQLQADGFSQNNVNADFAGKILSLETELAEAKGQLADAQKQIADMKTSLREDTGSFRKYTVQDGDTLETICDSIGLDYIESSKMILAINGLSDESEIVAGQAILLPVE